MNVRTLFRATLPLLCFCSVVAFSQSTPAAPEPAAASLPAASVPTDPAEMMKTAADLNGLEGSNIKPWHLKATFQLYDSDGKPSEQGTFEEYWAGPHKYKRIYISPSFTQTEWAIENGHHYRTGARYPRPHLLALVRSQLLAPLPPEEEMNKASFTQYSVNLKKATYSCVSVKRKIEGLKDAPAELSPTYCFDPATLVLRISMTPGGEQSIANGIASFQSRYLPRAVRVNTFDKPRLDIHMDSLVGLPSVIPSDFDLSPNASIVQEAAALPTDRKLWPKGTTPPSLVHAVDPIYPEALSTREVQGMVFVEAQIEVDGSVADVTILSSSDPHLAEAAAAAVKQYKFTPATLDGQPVKATFRVEVDFRVR
jgi:TonB family protein